MSREIVGTTMRYMALCLAVAWVSASGAAHADRIGRRGVKIQSFSPAGGTAGTGVELGGIGFAPGDRLLLGDTDCGPLTITRKGRRISAVVPVGARSGPFSIVRDGVAVARSTSAFELVEAPKVASVVPPDGPAGVEVTLSGSGFDPRSRVWMDWPKKGGRLGRRELAVVRRADGEIAVRIPRGARDGRLWVCTFDACDTTNTFDLHQRVPISRIYPLRGSPGTRITVVINGWPPVPGMGRFTLGGVELREVQRSEQRDLSPVWSLELEVPPGARSGPIEVETYGVLRPTGYRFRVTK